MTSRSMKRYSEIFGLPMLEEYHITAGHEREGDVRRAADARAKITSFFFGQVQFELLQPLGGLSVWQDFLDRTAPACITSPSW